MQKISYTGESFLVADSAAQSLVDLGAALGREGDTLTVVIPGINEDGDTVSVQMLLGPASELLAIPIITDVSEPDSAEAIEVMREQLREVERRNEAPHAVPLTDPLYDDDDEV